MMMMMIIIIIINRPDFNSLCCLLITYLEVFSSAHSFRSLIFYVPSPKSRYHVSQLTNNLPEFFCITVFTGLQNSFSPIVYDVADCEFVASHTSTVDPRKSNPFQEAVRLSICSTFELNLPTRNNVN